MKKKEASPAMRVSWISIIVNLVLAVFKLLAGIVAHSSAMISDAVHSASDVLSTFIVIAGIRISNKESDEGHQYGHERMECIASVILAVMLFATGAGIGIDGIRKIISGNYETLAVPGILALIAAIVSVVVKEWMFRFTKGVAKRINSTSLMADAWHHRSDSLSSIGSFAGVLGARLGLRVADPIASAVICLFIIKAAWDVFRTAMDQMVDRACDRETEEQIGKIITECEGVMTLDLLKTRMFGAKLYVDVEIGADGNLTLYQAHAIAERVHDEIEARFPLVKHCMVHVNPR